MKYIKNLYLLLRVKHYIKNILIFVPLIFSGELFNEKYFYSAIWGFILFSLITSVVYIINDINDYEYDKINEAKKNRPIANGSISKTNALIIAMILLSLFFLFAYMLYTWGGGIFKGYFYSIIIFTVKYRIQLWFKKYSNNRCGYYCNRFHSSSIVWWNNYKC